MKLLFVLLLLPNLLFSQIYLTGGVHANSYVGFGEQIDVGVRHKMITLSTGVMHNLTFTKDELLLPQKIGVVVRNLHMYVGPTFINSSLDYDDGDKFYCTYIVGVEYCYSHYKKASFYVGGDYIRNTVYLKVGMKFNFHKDD